MEPRARPLTQTCTTCSRRSSAIWVIPMMELVFTVFFLSAVGFVRLVRHPRVSARDLGDYD